MLGIYPKCPSSMNAGASTSSDRSKMDRVGAGEAQLAAGLQKLPYEDEDKQVRAASSSLSPRRAVMTTATTSGLPTQASLATPEAQQACYGLAASPSKLRYNTLVTLSIAMLAMAMIQPAFAALSCEVSFISRLREAAY